MDWLHRKKRPRRPDPFFAIAHDLQCILTLEGRLTRINPAFAQTLGHAEGSLLNKSLLDLMHPEDRPEATARLAELAHGQPINSQESRLQSATGTTTWIIWSAALAEGLVYLTAHDCTARKQAEQSLREADSLCSGILESTTDAFFSVDRAWRLTRVNRHAERLWRCQRSQILGRNLWEVFPEAVGGPFYTLYDRVMRTGLAAQLEDFYPHPPHDLWFEVHAYPSPDGLYVFFRDVTEHRQSQEKIKRSLQEKEVLLREVHHRVKNNLQVICSLLRLQGRHIHDETLLQALRDCRERVLAMALLHDQLHRAQDLSNIDLGEYIRSLAAGLFCSYGVNSADVDLCMDIDGIAVPIDIAIPCGLIVNELVSNSLRHAFPQGRGRISLALHQRPHGQAELVIGDNGQGICNSPQPRKNRSLGLWLVDLLAEQIDAAVERPAGAGTIYRLVFQTTESKEEKSNE